MSRLWTNDRDTLVEHLNLWRPNLAAQTSARVFADDLIREDTVQVLDPDDTELRKRLVNAAWQAVPPSERSVSVWKTLHVIVRAVVEALRQP